MISKLIVKISRSKATKKIFMSSIRLYLKILDKITFYNNLLKVEFKRDQLKKIGKNTIIVSPNTIVHPENLSIGSNTYIGPNSFIAAHGGLTIGNNCSISNSFLVYTSSHQYKNGKKLPHDKEEDIKPVAIEDNVWIGDHVAIIPGVTIGEGAIVGMGSVVTKNVPPLAIMGGNPAKVIKYRDKKTYEKLKAEKKFIHDEINLEWGK